MEEENQGENNEKGFSPAELQRIEKRALKKNNKETQAEDSGQRSQLEKVEILVLSVTKNSPGKTGKEVSQDVFQAYPVERQKEKTEPGKRGSSFGP